MDFENTTRYSRYMSKKAKSRKRHHLLAYVVLSASFVLLLVILVVFFRKSTPTASHIEQVVASSVVSIPDFETKVPLTNGYGIVPPGDAGYVKLTPPYLLVKTPAGYDVFAVMNYNLGGSGVFANIALFHYANNRAEHAGVYPIGDRVPVNNISGPTENSTGNYDISVDFLDRTATQSMADTPTVAKTLHTKIINGKFFSK